MLFLYCQNHENDRLGFLPGNNLPRMMIQHNVFSHFYLGTTNADLLYLDKSQYIQPRLLHLVLLIKFRRGIGPPNTF